MPTYFCQITLYTDPDSPSRRQRTRFLDSTCPSTVEWFRTTKSRDLRRNTRLVLNKNSCLVQCTFVPSKTPVSKPRGLKISPDTLPALSHNRGHSILSSRLLASCPRRGLPDLNPPSRHLLALLLLCG